MNLVYDNPYHAEGKPGIDRFDREIVKPFVAKVKAALTSKGATVSEEGSGVSVNGQATRFMATGATNYGYSSQGIVNLWWEGARRVGREAKPCELDADKIADALIRAADAKKKKNDAEQADREANRRAIEARAAIATSFGLPSGSVSRDGEKYSLRLNGLTEDVLTEIGKALARAAGLRGADGKGGA